MDPAPAIILTRSAEHLTVEAIGVFTVWLGYRLFRDMPLRREGEAKLGLPGGVSIFVSRVGPGVFFALFGTAVIGYIIARPWSYQEWSGADSSAGRALSGFMENSVAAKPAPRAPDGTLPRERLVHVLAEMSAELANTPMDPKRVQREIALRDARGLLMLDGWDSKWGNPDSFMHWLLNRGEDAPPPADAVAAVATYQGRTP